MAYVFAEVAPENCQKMAATDTVEARDVPCPTGTTFHSYAVADGKTAKVCCPQPARLTAVPSLNTPNAPMTPLDCPRGSRFIESGTGNQCAYCFGTAGGEPCPGLPGIGSATKPQMPIAPSVPPSISFFYSNKPCPVGYTKVSPGTKNEGCSTYRISPSLVPVPVTEVKAEIPATSWFERNRTAVALAVGVVAGTAIVLWRGRGA